MPTRPLGSPTTTHERACGARDPRPTAQREGSHRTAFARRQDSSSARRVTSSVVTTPPRLGNTVKPFRSVSGESVGRVNACLIRSETTRPIVVLPRSDNSLAAANTSSSISSVVRMHLMLSHQMHRFNGAALRLLPYHRQFANGVPRRVRRGATWCERVRPGVTGAAGAGNRRAARRAECWRSAHFSARRSQSVKQMLCAPIASPTPRQ
jgi:hypothetical protein